jgi:hypothetical protein
MKKLFALCLMWSLLFCGCVPQDTPATQPTTVTTTVTTEATTEATTEPTTEATTEATTRPEHSPLYLPQLDVEDVIRYFNEVCLNAEIVNAGDPTKLQKWVVPIRYYINGTYTEEDKVTLDNFVSWLNQIEGFPGMHIVDDPVVANLSINFCGPEDYIALMGENFHGTDGGVTFWYNGANQIFDAVIGYRTDLSQEVRNSVILEEIYNGLGPINDTWERLTSIIYGGYSTPQWLSEEDQLILKLLFHPMMECGMNAAECEAVIRQLYY